MCFQCEVQPAKGVCTGAECGLVFCGQECFDQAHKVFKATQIESGGHALRSLEYEDCSSPFDAVHSLCGGDDRCVFADRCIIADRCASADRCAFADRCVFADRCIIADRCISADRCIFADAAHLLIAACVLMLICIKRAPHIG
jgi:hypothetical protein